MTRWSNLSRKEAKRLGIEGMWEFMRMEQEEEKKDTKKDKKKE